MPAALSFPEKTLPNRRQAPRNQLVRGEASLEL
jgi:hypothetical protein